MAETQAHTPKKLQSAKPQTPTIRADLDRIASASKPWWGEAPDIAAKCLALIFAPVRYAAIIADTAVSLAFLTVIGTAVLWWNGYISDATVAHYLGELGDRGLAILQASGVF